MWNKLVICVVTSLSLIGCSNTLGEADDNPALVPNVTITQANHGPSQPIGHLSKLSSDTNVAAIESRLSTYLKGDVSRITFAKGTVPYFQSAGRSEPPLNVNVRGFKSPRGLVLVIRHLEAAAVSAIPDLPMKPCKIGSVYTGYAAANQNLDFYDETETGPIWDWAIPYGLVVCVTGKDFDVLALPLDHIIFAGDKKKTEVLKMLPKDHPLFDTF